MAVDCKSLEAKKLKMFGFEIPGQGFYSFNLPDSKVKVNQTTGLITILEGEASEERVDTELKNLVEAEWDFKVRKIDNQEFLAVFPDKGSLETLTKLSEFQLSVYGLKVKIGKTERDVKTSSLLQTVWIKVHDIPDFAREAEAVKEAVGLVAEPLVVDELSLIRDGPVRVQSRCRNPGAIRGSIEIFFNGEGTFIGFEVEKDSKGGAKGEKDNPPGPGKPDDKSDKDRDRFYKGENSKRGNDKFDRFGKIDRDIDSSHEESMEEDLEEIEKDSGGSDKPTDATPLAAFHPNMGMVSPPFVGPIQGCQNSSGKPLSESASKSDNNSPNEIGKSNLEESSQFIVHGIDGPYLMEKNRWPNLILPEETMEGLTQEESLVDKDNLKKGSEGKGSLARELEALPKENSGGVKMHTTEEDIMDSISNFSRDSDMEEVSQGWQSAKRKAKKKKLKPVVVATRTSKRIPRDGVPIAEKASSRAMAKNNITGTSNLPNPFTILNSTPIPILQSVMSDLNIVVENVEDQIDIFRLEENARAAIAEANYRVFLEKQKERDKPCGDEFMDDLALGIIDNSGRGISDHEGSSMKENRAMNSERCIESTKGGSNNTTSGALRQRPNELCYK